VTTYRALIPVKSLSEAKSRLATHLALHERENLVLDMLQHVLQVLRDSNVLEQIAVVSPDQRVLRQAQAWGAQAVVEEIPGHNEALNAAAVKELVAGTTALLTIAADLPLLHPSDIRMLVAVSCCSCPFARRYRNKRHTCTSTPCRTLPVWRKQPPMLSTSRQATGAR
jgi:2-phospho-L-lactate guanylyltransferase